MAAQKSFFLKAASISFLSIHKHYKVIKFTSFGNSKITSSTTITAQLPVPVHVIYKYVRFSLPLALLAFSRFQQNYIIRFRNWYDFKIELIDEGHCKGAGIVSNFC